MVTGIEAEGLVININNGNLRSTFNGNGKGFQNPHDIAVSKDGNTVFEAELNPFVIWKLTNGEGTIKPNKDSNSSGPLGFLRRIWGYFG